MSAAESAGEHVLASVDDRTAEVASAEDPARAVNAVAVGIVAGDWVEEVDDLCHGLEIVDVVAAGLVVVGDVCGHLREHRGGELRRSWWRGRETRETLKVQSDGGDHKGDQISCNLADSLSR